MGTAQTSSSQHLGSERGPQTLSGRVGWQTSTNEQAAASTITFEDLVTRAEDTGAEDTGLSKRLALTPKQETTKSDRHL